MISTLTDLKSTYISRTGQTQFTGFYSTMWHCRTRDLQSLCPKDDLHFLASSEEASKILITQCDCGTDFIPMDQRTIHPLIKEANDEFPDEADRVEMIANHLGDDPDEEFEGFTSAIDFEVCENPVLLCDNNHKYIVHESDISDLIDNAHNKCAMCQQVVDLTNATVDPKLKDINQRFFDGLPNDLPPASSAGGDERALARPYTPHTPWEPSQQELCCVCTVFTVLVAVVAVVAILAYTAIFGTGWIRIGIDRMMQFRRIVR